MRIGVNLLSLYPGKIGGLEQYVRNFILHASKLGNDNKFFIFLNKSSFYTFDENNVVKKILIDENSDRDVQIYHWIIELMLEVWFCPLLVLEPKYVRIPSVITIPDLQHEFYPEFFEDKILKWRIENYKYSVHHSDAILTISEYSKTTIVNSFGVPESKVTRTYLDASYEFDFVPDETIRKKVAQEHSLPDEYGFYPANTWPHKNHLSLLQAIVILRDKFNKKINIVLTGSEDRAHQSIKKFIQENDLESQVRFLGYVSKELLPYIYSNSQFLVFPSLFEGFGIPLVEAMRTRTPIICSNAGSITEITADCALLFDPIDPEDIAHKILNIHEEEIRIKCIEKGSKRAEIFSWKACAEQTLDVFRGLIK